MFQNRVLRLCHKPDAQARDTIASFPRTPSLARRACIGVFRQSLGAQAACTLARYDCRRCRSPETSRESVSDRRCYPPPLEIVQLLRCGFIESYELDLPPPGEVAGYRVGGRATSTRAVSMLKSPQEPSPLVTSRPSGCEGGRYNLLQANNLKAARSPTWGGKFGSCDSSVW